MTITTKTFSSFTPAISKQQQAQPAQLQVQSTPPRAAPLTVADGFDAAPANQRRAMAALLGGTGQSVLPTAAEVNALQDTDGGEGAPVADANAAGGTGGTTNIPAAAGVDPQFYGGPVPESPEQAQAWLSDPNNPRYQGVNGTELRTQDLAWLAANDPSKLPEVFTALGPEGTSQLLSSTMNGVMGDNSQFFPNDAAVQSTFESIATALGTMPADFQTQVGAQLARSGDVEASLILGHGGPGLDAARRGYLDTAREQAKTDPLMARAVGNVLAGSQALVNEYVQAWGNDFLTILDKGLGDIQPFSRDSYHSEYASMQHDGLEQVVGMMANYDGPDAQLHKAQVFGTAARTLDEQGNDNTALIAGLDQLFLSDSRGIVEWLSDGTRPDQANLSGANRQANPAMDATGEALSLYFQESVFENPDPNGAVVQQVNTLVGQLKDELLAAPTEEGRNRVGAFLGYLVGTAALGYEGAHEANQDSQDARAALVNMIFEPLEGAASGAASAQGGPAAGLLAGQIVSAGSDKLVDFLNSGLRNEQNRMQSLFDNVLTSVFSGLPVEYQTAVNGMLGRILGLDDLP